MGLSIPVTLGVIEPLALTPSKSQKIALVCEDGGQRSIFTAGVFNEVQRTRFNPFQLMPGTSVEAKNLPALICGQPDYSRRVMTHYIPSKLIFALLRIVRGGNLNDLDWLIDITRTEFPLADNNADYDKGWLA